MGWPIQKSTLSILLFIPSGQEDFPSWRFCSISLVSFGFNLIPWIEGVLSLMFNFWKFLLIILEVCLPYKVII